MTTPAPSAAAPSSTPEPDKEVNVAVVRRRVRDAHSLVAAMKVLLHGWDGTTSISALGIVGAHLCDSMGLPREILLDAVLNTQRMAPPTIDREKVDAKAFASAAELEKEMERTGVPIRLEVKRQRLAANRRTTGRRGKKRG